MSQSPTLSSAEVLVLRLTVTPGALSQAVEDANLPGLRLATQQGAEVSFGKSRLAFRAVRTPAHKLIDWKDPARADELYDLAADPGEGRNLIAEPASRAVLEHLRSRLLAWMGRNGDPALAWPASP